MKETLKRLIAKNWYFSPPQQELLANSFHFRELGKGNLLLDQSEVCQSLYFLEKGAAYQYYLNDNEEEEITGLFVAGNWVINRESFIGQNPSETVIRTFCDCRVAELRIEAMHELIASSPAFFQLGRLLKPFPGSNLRLGRRSPDERYRQLLEDRPEILKTFPLRMIASYLGMSPETLSRVRGRLR